MTTMKDIAKHLNISINAVSLALNDKEGVSHELRMKILETASMMNYPLKKLNNKDTLKNKTLVVLLESKKRNDIYYSEFLHQLTIQAHIYGYRIIDEYYDIHQFMIPKIISEHHCAGVIILGKITPHIITHLLLYIQEIICVNHYLGYMNIDSITINDYLSGYMACEYLILKGCQKIGFIGDIDTSMNFKQRYQGYKQCLYHYHYQESLTIIHDIEEFIIKQQYFKIQNKLANFKTIPEAFICVNDTYASMTLKALQYSGYKIPKDTLLIGFDNLYESHKLNITSLSVSREEMAKKAIRRIHEMIHEQTKPETILLTPQIFERDSTKK